MAKEVESNENDIMVDATKDVVSIDKSEKSDQKRMKAFLKDQPRVRIILEKLNDKPNCKVQVRQANGKLKEYASYGEPLHMNMNGYHYYIPRNVYVDVPQSVADELEANKQLVEKGERLSLENTKGLEALSELNAIGTNEL